MGELEGSLMIAKPVAVHIYRARGTGYNVSLSLTSRFRDMVGQCVLKNCACVIGKRRSYFLFARE